MNQRIQLSFFIVSIIVHLFFYISAYFTHTLTPFFAHATIGQDFFQIPNAAYAFLHGGTLTGALPHGIQPYINCCGVNPNVYHPLFTLLVGVPLQFFPPWTAMAVWAVVHIIIMAILVFFLWKKFRHHKYVYLALGLLLINSYHYYEIWLTQYQFLFNFFTLLFLYEEIKHGDTQKAGIWLLLSLLVKPIGLLWVIPLLLYKRIRTVAIGVGFYIVITCIFTLFPFGQYFLHNFFSVSQATAATHNLYAIKHIAPSFPLGIIKLTSLLAAIGLILFQIKKKPSLFTIIVLWTGYQLIFYTLVYHYQYTIFAGLLCLGILLNVFPLKKLSLILILFLTLPTPVIFFNLLGKGFFESKDYAPIWLYSIFWLVCFLVYLVMSTFRRTKGSLYEEDALGKKYDK